jgi:hypothetical protein
LLVEARLLSAYHCKRRKTKNKEREICYTASSVAISLRTAKGSYPAITAELLLSDRGRKENREIGLAGFEPQIVVTH